MLETQTHVNRRYPGVAKGWYHSSKQLKLRQSNRRATNERWLDLLCRLSRVERESSERSLSPASNGRCFGRILYDAKVFSTLDLRNGFFHVDMDSESIKYASFVVPNGQYEFLKTPLGLCNSPLLYFSDS